MIKILINGINGKMGKEVAKLVSFDPALHLLGGIDKLENTVESECNNPPYKLFTSFNNISEMPDVIIDFSTPEATMSLLKFAMSNHIPVVIATTGFSDNQQRQIQEASKSIAIFQSSNFSYEVTLMSKIIGELAKVLPQSEIEILETHHSQKSDAPSGTAIMLANEINKATNQKYTYNFNRLAQTQEINRDVSTNTTSNHSSKSLRKPNEIGFSSIRGGNIVGKHNVLFFSPNETLEIRHSSYSRSIFAEGSIRAAKFLVKEIKPKVGMYHMDSLIGA